MNNKLYEIKQRINQWMQGRNGADDFSTTVIVLAMVLYLIGVFAHFKMVLFLALVAVIYGFFRMTSRNIEARRAENREFLKRVGPARPWIKNPPAAWKEFRAYKHLICENCGQRMRIPRGRGKLRVSCPRCGHKFEYKS